MDERKSTVRYRAGRLRLLAGVAISAAALLAASGCSGSDQDSTSSGTTGGGEAIITGAAKCDQASMQKAVESWAEGYGDGEKATLAETSGSFRCADGWAVAFPDLGPAATAVTVTAVFEAEGQFWIPKDRAKVCGDNASDSAVPKSLYRDACQTN